jgi:hypothetical protein
MSKVEQQENWHHYIGDDGTPEALNVHTGEIAKRDISMEDLKDHHQVKIGDQWYWVPVTDIAAASEYVPLKYSPLLADTVCRFIVEGHSLEKSAQKAGISYFDLCKFRQRYPDFETMVQGAKKYRAEYQFERLQEIAEETGEAKDEVALARLKSDIYKYTSAIGDDSLNPRTKVAMDTTVGIKIADTGVRRERDLSPEETELFARIEEGQTKLVSGKGDK